MRWYALAGALGLAGLAVAAGLVWRFVAGLEEPVRFLAPGTGIVERARPGRYVVWNEYRTLFDGRAFSTSRALPEGVRIGVAGPDGRVLDVQPFGGASSNMPSADSVSVARFEALVPGRHAVTVEGAFAPRVIAVGPDFAWPVLKTAAAALAAAAIGLGAALAAALYGFLQSVHSSESEKTPEGTLRKLAALVYGLQAASLVVGVTLIAGVIINYLKRREVEGSWLESHFRWQIRTFWWMLAWSVLGLALLVALVGVPILLAATVWFVYRLAKGWTRLNDGKPMYGEITSPRP